MAGKGGEDHARLGRVESEECQNAASWSCPGPEISGGSTLGNWWVRGKMFIHKGPIKYEIPAQLKPPPHSEITPPVSVNAPEDLSEVTSALDSAPSGLVTTKHCSFVPSPPESHPQSLWIPFLFTSFYVVVCSSFGTRACRRLGRR